MSVDPTILRRRYRSLWMGEAAASLVFVGLLLRVAVPSGDWRPWVARSLSLAIVVMILLQAIGWWRAKLAALDRGERILPVRTLRTYRRWRTINWVSV